MKKLREGFTTGSCAAAAALACCLWQRDGQCPRMVSIRVPEGRTFAPDIIAHPDGSCGVIKDGGDDPDITTGLEVVVSVRIFEEEGGVCFRAGEGVGIVTQDGLKIARGQPAINPAPRRMIAQAVRGVFPTRRAVVTVSIPGGREAAKKTFNPRLGIRDGLSILGTSGVVRPMSEQALRESLYAELKMRVAQGARELVFTFGNQGEASMRALFERAVVVQVSNEMGFMLDSALELGVKRLLIGGHPGKLAKIAAGVMQTHSQYADARREAIVTHLALMGANVSLLNRVYACVTTDACIELIRDAGMDAVWNRLARAARRYCRQRVRDEIDIEVCLTDARGRVLGESWREDK